MTIGSLLQGLQLLLTGEFEFDAIEVCENLAGAERAIMAKGGHVHLIITDFYIPGHDTRIMIAKLRSLAPGAKIICISASLSPDDERIATSVGADLYLPKHTDPTTLVAAIQSLLEGCHPQSQLRLQSRVSNLFQLTPRQSEILYEIAKGTIEQRDCAQPETFA